MGGTHSSLFRGHVAYQYEYLIIKFIYSVKEATKKKTIFSIVSHLIPGAYVVIYYGNLYVVPSTTLLLCNLGVFNYLEGRKTQT